MNDIRLKSCVFNNFMSYGNTVNEFTFPDGVVWMTADNGSGKSTLVEAICFALFGRSYRGGTIKELRNTRNVDGVTRVMLEFECSKVPGEWDLYRVTRTINVKGTTKFEVERMEGDQWVSQNKRAGYAQKDFEESVLGFNEVLFKHDIAMNTQESEPFMEMETKDRRELLESIIMVNMKPMKEETNRRLSDASSRFDIAESDIGRIGGEIEKLTAICTRLREEKQQNIELMEKRLGEEQEIVRAAQEKCKQLAAACESKKSEVDNYASQTAMETSVDTRLAQLSTASMSLDAISRYTDEFNSVSSEFAKARDEYTNMPGYLNGTRLAHVRGSVTAINNEIRAVSDSRHKEELEVTKLNTRLEEVVTRGKNLKPGVPCPMCGKPSTKEDIEPHRQELLRQYNDLRKQIGDKTAVIATVDTSLADLQLKLSEAEKERVALEAEAEQSSKFYSEKVSPLQMAVSRAQATLDNAKREVANVGIDPAQFAEEIARLQAEKAKFPEIRAKWQAAHAEFNALSVEQQKYLGECESHMAIVSTITADIEKAKQIASDDSLAIAEKQLDEARNDLADAELRFHTASDERIALDYISKRLCADDGIKKMLFSNFVPAFNESVERNIAKLNLPFHVTFTDSMDYTFESGPGMAPSYKMLSQGQRRKLGFAISMAFRDFVSMVGNFRINFLAMDEVLDISTDDEGMREMLDIVRSMASEIGCALVITHRGNVVADKFDYKLRVEHDGNYSTLGELERL